MVSAPGARFSGLSWPRGRGLWRLWSASVPQAAGSNPSSAAVSHAKGGEVRSRPWHPPTRGSQGSHRVTHRRSCEEWGVYSRASSLSASAAGPGEQVEGEQARPRRALQGHSAPQRATLPVNAWRTFPAYFMHFRRTSGTSGVLLTLPAAAIQRCRRAWDTSRTSSHGPRRLTAGTEAPAHPSATGRQAAAAVLPSSLEEGRKDDRSRVVPGLRLWKGTRGGAAPPSIPRLRARLQSRPVGTLRDRGLVAGQSGGGQRF